MNSVNFLNIIDEMGEGLSKQFSETIPTEDILLTLLIAIVSSLIVVFIYKRTYVGVSYTKNFSLSIILLTLVTSIVIRTINSNLSLTLGMVGALSIVRFRTAVKDPIDTIFMFWAITIGIMSGAGLYVVSLLSTLIIGFIYYISFAFQIKKTNKLLLVVNCDMDNSKKVINLLKGKKKCSLKTEMYQDNKAELTFEVASRKDIEEVLLLNNSSGMESINVIDID